jgi:hypothetical protein
MPNVRKITAIFHCKTLQNLPNLVFWFEICTVWQPWSEILEFYWLQRLLTRKTKIKVLSTTASSLLSFYLLGSQFCRQIFLCASLLPVCPSEKKAKPKSKKSNTPGLKKVTTEARNALLPRRYVFTSTSTLPTSSKRRQND